METTFFRKDGSKVKLVQIAYNNLFSPEIGIDTFAVVSRQGKEDKYHYPCDFPNKSMNGLTVEQYSRSDRNGLLAVLKPIEILKARSELLNNFQINA